jgi:phosphate starvation-inducible protein PhoH
VTFICPHVSYPTFLTDKDVVRHQLVQKVILAYEEYQSKKKPNSNTKA